MCYRSIWFFTWNQVYSVFRFTLQSSHFALSLFHFFPLGSRNFFFFPSISLPRPVSSYGLPEKKANECLSFSRSGSLRLCKRKERRRIVISNHQQTQQRYHFGRKKWQQVKMVCSVAGGIFFFLNDGGSQDHSGIREGSWSLKQVRGRTQKIKRKR